MGSHWWHWKMKSSLCALAVWNVGVHHKFYPGKTDFSLYFPISWLFWMGSHWSHWTAKSLLCALAVSNGGSISFTPRGKSENLSSNEFYALLHRRSFRITYKRPNECFPIYLLGNTINVCWNPLNRAHFSKTIDLRGHMRSFTLKLNVFPSISESPEMWVETIRTGLVFPRQSIWGVTYLGLLKNEHFSMYLLRNARNVCCNHQERVCFSETIDLRGHMTRFTLKMNVFPSICLATA